MTDWIVLGACWLVLGGVVTFIVGRHLHDPEPFIPTPVTMLGGSIKWYPSRQGWRDGNVERLFNSRINREA